MFGGAIEAGSIVLPAVAAINAKEGPEIDHEHNRDNPISKKHGHLMSLATLYTIMSGAAWI